MPQFDYRGRDREGRLRVGKRAALSIDILNAELIKEGISPIQIDVVQLKRPLWDRLQDHLQSDRVYLEELAVFTRQMQLLHQANVPMVTALKQLREYTRSFRLGTALDGLVEHLEKGESLSVSMQHFPETFSPLIINLVQIGESTGQLSAAFGRLYQYLEFEISSVKQIKQAFRYPIFVLVSIVSSIIILNIFVIPTFARFYTNLTVSLPWQTTFLIDMSDFVINFGPYLLVLSFIGGVFLYRYLKTPEGKYRKDKIMLKIPLSGKLLKRIILIRFCQLFSITLSASISVTQGLQLVKNSLTNAYIVKQIADMQESIERGMPFTQAITKIELFSPLESQILSVGERSGELSPALEYIADFHGREIEYDLRRLSETIGPVLIALVSGLILIIALGVYLPVWNMINLSH